MEIWQDIKGFEGKYQVSNTGKVKSLNFNNTGKEKVLIPKTNKQGHLEITLNKNNQHNYVMVNRLVIKAFTNKELSKNDIVMYKDENKRNCSIDNLYIISRGKRQELTYNADRRYRNKYDYYGEKLALKEIAKKNNNEISVDLIDTRIRKLYWNIYEAAEIPKQVTNRKETIKNG